MCKHPVLPIVELQSVTRNEKSGRQWFLYQRPFPISPPEVASKNLSSNDSFAYDEQRIARFLAIGSQLCTISFA